ncbi:MAG: type II secretion system protein [Patescibacteria group bacterium]
MNLKKNSKSNKLKRGFTLIELLVVISIIGLLSSMAFYAFNASRMKARDVKRISDMNQIRIALELYYDEFNQYPDNTDSGDVGCWSSWDAGSTLNGDSDLFIQPLVTNDFISIVPRESYPILGGIFSGGWNQCSYRYIRVTNPCSCSGTYAVLFTVLETNSTGPAQSDERSKCFYPEGVTCWGEGGYGYDYAIYLKE